MVIFFGCFAFFFFLVVSMVSLVLVWLFCFSRFGGFARFSLVLFWLFRFGGFVSPFRFLVHAIRVSDDLSVIIDLGYW